MCLGKCNLSLALLAQQGPYSKNTLIKSIRSFDLGFFGLGEPIDGLKQDLLHTFRIQALFCPLGPFLWDPSRVFSPGSSLPLTLPLIKLGDSRVQLPSITFLDVVLYGGIYLTPFPGFHEKFFIH